MLLPGLNVAWVFNYLFLMISKVLLIVVIATTFLSINSGIVGLKFLTGPLDLPGFGSSINCSKLSFSGLMPVSAVLFSISAMNSRIMVGLLFRRSASIR